MSITSERLRKMTPEQRANLHENARKRIDDGGREIIELIESSGLPLSSGGMRLSDPAYTLSPISRKGHMHNLAAALAITLSYLDGRSSNSTEDDDVDVLEAIAAKLQNAPSDEKKAVISALVHIGRTDLVDGLGLD